MKINIIGFGVVGQAVYASIHPEVEQQVRIFDTTNPRFQAMQEKDARTLAPEDVIFICVDTPSTALGQDAKNIQTILDLLLSVNFQGLIIIKSTVLYKNIARFLDTKLKIIVNPEFLSANHSNDDFKEQDYIVLGGPSDLTCLAMNLFDKIFLFANDRIEYELCSIKEAIDFKYMRNMYQAYKVLFWEFVQDTTGNARKMNSMLNKLPIGENSQVGMDGTRGFSGACLPKDLKALANNGAELHTTLSYMLDYNQELKERR